MASAIARWLPKLPRWASPICVITPIAGAQSEASEAMSPGRLAPSSSTAKSCSGRTWRRLRGSPMWLLKFRGLAVPDKRLASTVWIIWRLVLLPTLPVTAITVPGNCRRFQPAHCSRACWVSSTRSTQRPPGGSTGRETTAPAAPRSKASSANSAPSWCGPTSAQKRSPGPALRLSVTTGPRGHVAGIAGQVGASLSPPRIVS